VNGRRKMEWNILQVENILVVCQIQVDGLHVDLDYCTIGTSVFGKFSRDFFEKKISAKIS
jgi:hypothetical protein